MDYIRDRKSNFSFSLHDSRIVQIEIDEKKIIFEDGSNISICRG